MTTQELKDFVVDKTAYTSKEVDQMTPRQLISVWLFSLCPAKRKRILNEIFNPNNEIKNKEN